MLSDNKNWIWKCTKKYCRTIKNIVGQWKLLHHTSVNGKLVQENLKSFSNLTLSTPCCHNNKLTFFFCFCFQLNIISYHDCFFLFLLFFLLSLLLLSSLSVQPSYDFNQHLDKILTDFIKIRTESVNKIQTQYLTGWLYKMHEETQYAQQQTSCIPITIMDANGNSWNEFAKNQFQSSELNCSVVCTSWMLKRICQCIFHYFF